MEIIKHVLCVSDEDFSSNVDDSRFGRPHEPTSNLLLVCKAWMRIAMPYLYECVVLRTSGQVEAFMDVMNDKVIGRELKPLVRRIRLEDHFGMLTKSLLDLFPNILELYIPYPGHGEEDIGGLCDAFSKIKPEHVIIGYAGALDSREFGAHEHFIDALSIAVKHSWTTLVRFFLFFFRYLYISSDYYRGHLKYISLDLSARNIIFFISTLYIRP